MSRLVGTTTATDPNGTSLVVSKPFDTRNGNVLFAHVASNNQAVTAPAGWTKFQDSTIDVFRVQQFYKTAGAFEPSSYTFTVPANTPLVAVMTSWDGIDRVTPTGANEHPSATSLTHSEPFHTPDINPSTVTAGRLLFLRCARRVDSTPGSPVTYSASGVTELADVGVFSGGTVSYSIGLFAADADFTFQSTHSGLDITASPGTADTHNVVSTIAMTGAPTTPGGPESIYQRAASDGAATLNAGQSLTVISDGEVGDPVLGGGFRVHTQFDFESDPGSFNYDVLYSKPFEGEDGRNGWISKIRAVDNMTDVGLTTHAILMQVNPIVGA